MALIRIHPYELQQAQMLRLLADVLDKLGALQPDSGRYVHYDENIFTIFLSNQVFGRVIEVDDKGRSFWRIEVTELYAPQFIVDHAYLQQLLGK